MSKGPKYILILVGILAVVAAVLIGLAVWALDSAEGTRALFKAVSVLTPLHIDGREISGRLRDGLTVRDLHVRWSNLELDASIFRLRWRAGEVWNRKIIIQEISLEGARLRDNRPPAREVSLPGWPAAPFWLTRFQGRIDAWEARKVTYQRGNHPPTVIDRLFARVGWDGNVLTIRDFKTESPLLEAEGMLKLGFYPPALEANLQAVPAGEYAGFDSFAAQVTLEPGGGGDHSSGRILVSARRKGKEGLRFESGLQATRTSLELRDSRLFQPGRQGILQGEGEFDFGYPPKFRLTADFRDWNLAPELGQETDLSGTVEAKGKISDYKGMLFIKNGVKGWHEGRATLPFHGGPDRLEIRDLDAAWIEGSLKGPVHLSWSKGIEAAARIQGRNLNPALIDPRLKSKANLNLEGKFSRPNGKTLQASFRADLLPSSIYGREVTGDMAGRIKGGLLEIEKLALHGKGFMGRARGILQEKLTVEAQVSDLSALIPDARGSLIAAGWMRVPLFAPAAFSLEGQAQNIEAGSVSVDSANMKIAGTPASHEVLLSARFSGEEIEGAALGSYAHGSWKGVLEKFQGTDASGVWALEEPARLAASSDHFEVAPLKLKSTRGERLQSSLDLSWTPVRGSLKGSWESLDLARLNPWLSDGSLSGRGTGSLSLNWKKEGLLISASNTFQGAFAREDKAVQVPSAKMKLDWNEKGLLALASLNLKKGGKAEARVSSAEPFLWALPKNGAVALEWESVDPALLIPLFTAEFNLKGSNSGKLAGHWLPGRRFDLAGKTILSSGQIAWKKKRKPVSLNIGAAEMDFSWRGEALQGSLSAASPENGWMKGAFLLPLRAAVSPSVNRNAPLSVSIKGEIRETGFLAALYPDSLERSEGKGKINVRAGGTWNKPDLEGALQISDAVIQFHSPGAPAVSPSPSVEISSASATLGWTSRGLAGALEVITRNNGKMAGKIMSPEPARFSFPQEGSLDLTWSGLDLNILQPWLPEKIFVEGPAQGRIHGTWAPGLRLDLSGDLSASQGKLSWSRDGGAIHAAISRSALNFFWRGERIEGNLNFNLADYGFLKGAFSLPLSARPPFRFDPGGSLRVSLEGKAQESGLLAALFPGLVEETRGNVDFDVSAQGTWNQPSLEGSLRLVKAGAYLPVMGIRLEDVSARCRMQGEEIQIESLQARSGAGTVEGKGVVRLKKWKLDGFEGSLAGKLFQLFYRPDLRVQCNPDLRFQGTPGNIVVRGQISVPEAQIYGTSEGAVRPSPDVEIIDQPPSKKSSRSLDVRVKILLGDNVRVKAAGLDTRLAGGMDLELQGDSLENATARGEVRTLGGLYSGYGLDLRVEHGRFVYTGGPVENPGLDILALRKSEDVEKTYNVKVGLTILGTLNNPKVKLYSQPAMKDEEILSYLLLGRPYDPKQGNLALLLRGAGGALTGSSPGILGRVKSGLGIDTLDIQSSPTAQAAAGAAGSSAVQTSPTQEFQRSLVTVGKYLTPKLYVSYGYSAFTSEQLLTLRYQVSRHWQVETRRGNALGVDLYYRIEFY